MKLFDNGKAKLKSGVFFGKCSIMLYSSLFIHFFFKEFIEEQGKSVLRCLMNQYKNKVKEIENKNSLKRLLESASKILWESSHLSSSLSQHRWKLAWDRFFLLENYLRHSLLTISGTFISNFELTVWTPCLKQKNQTWVPVNTNFKRSEITHFK